MPLEKLMVIGKITASHGIRGLVRVWPEIHIGQVADITQCHLYRPDGRQDFFAIENVQQHKQFWLLKLTGISSRNEAETLRGALWVLHRDDAPELPDDHYYVPDLVGLEVITTHGEPVGRVRDVLFGPANDVYIVQRHGQSDALIPAVRQIVVEIDRTHGKMIIDAWPGLLD